MKYFKEMLLSHNSPLWFTIFVGIAAAVGTYLISPSLNYKFELKKIQVQHLVDTAKNLNDDMIQFQSDTRSFNVSLVKQHADIEENRAKLLDLVAKIQWRLIDARVVVNGIPDDETKVLLLRNSLTDFKITVEKLRNPLDQSTFLRAVAPVLSNANNLLSTVYQRAGFSQEGQASPASENAFDEIGIAPNILTENK